jgi:hypothetical protein
MKPTHKSGDALDKAGKAQESLGKAEDKANRAQRASSNALGIANDAKRVSSEARQEADSFEKDIVSAKTQAAEAESHLADALERANEAKRESANVSEKLADRTLTALQISLIAGRLFPYPGQEYEVVAYWESKESMGIANRINQALLLAHWKYVQLEHGTALLGGVTGVLVNVHPAADKRV